MIKIGDVVKICDLIDEHGGEPTLAAVDLVTKFFKDEKEESEDEDESEYSSASS